METIFRTHWGEGIIVNVVHFCRDIQSPNSILGLCDRKTAILSCCLGILQYDNSAHTKSLDI